MQEVTQFALSAYLLLKSPNLCYFIVVFVTITVQASTLVIPTKSIRILNNVIMA